METLSFLADISRGASTLFGILYAIFGTASISVNGHVAPKWASFVMRLFAPLLVLGLALMLSGLDDWRKTKAA